MLDDTIARGYTALEVSALNHDSRGNHPPFDGASRLPFTRAINGSVWTGSLLVTDRDQAATAPDLTAPDEAYWRRVDGFLRDCERRGLLVLMFPAYVGAGASDQGWMRELVANGPSRAHTYGAWIADRYRDVGNIVWMMGGDKGTSLDPFDATQTRVEAGLLAGLQSIPNQRSHFFSAEWGSEAIASDQPSFGTAMTLNGAYSWAGDVTTQGRRAYAHAPVEPAYLLEEPYDEEGPDGNHVNPSAIQPVRRFQWEGWLATTGGYVSGNGYVWPFRDATWRAWFTTVRNYASGSNRSWPLRSTSWRAHLDSVGAQDMTRLNAFVRSIAWYTLVPSGLGGTTTVVANNPTSSAPDHVSAAMDPDDSLIVAYVPPAHSGPLLLDLSAVAGPRRARWFDPTSGSYVAAGTVSPGGVRRFDTPGANQAQSTDWALVLDR